MLALTVVASGSPSDGAPSASLCRPGDQWLNFTADGEPHEALLHIPRGSRGRLALVLAFHGARYGARFVAKYYGLSKLSDAKGFAVLYPQATHNVFWQLPPDQHEDVDAVRALLDQIEHAACIDARRVYATGASNGGGFSARLGCEMADRLAAIAPVAGGYSQLGPCEPQRPLPVLEIHGTRDQVVPYNGSGPDHDGSVAAFLKQWTAIDRCRGDGEERRLRPNVIRLSWYRCADGTMVEHLRLAMTDHGWPGGDTGAAGLKNHPIPRHDPTGVKAANAVWSFVSRFRLPSAAARR